MLKEYVNRVYAKRVDYTYVINSFWRIKGTILLIF